MTGRVTLTQGQYKYLAAILVRAEGAEERRATDTAAALDPAMRHWRDEAILCADACRKARDILLAATRKR